MGKFSYLIKNNEWYTYKNVDICRVYFVFQKLYDELIKPYYGESKKCKVIYDRDLNVFLIKLDRRKKIRIFGNSNSVESKYMEKFVRLLTVSGIVATPLYKIKVTFVTNLSKMYLMHKRNVLISQSGYNANEGLYYLKGELS